MNYRRRYFDPAATPAEPGADPATRIFDLGGGRRSVYRYDDRLVLAINVALAAGRPLLLAGEPGCGKTTLARNAALVLGWSYYHYTVTSRSQSSELLWEFDALRRLNDANGRREELPGDAHYVEPGPLWWALAPGSASRRGMSEAQWGTAEALPDPGIPAGGARAVLLIDELDKAEPDLPNDLLEVLDVRSFEVRGRPVSAERSELLLVFSTNGERDFPGAFQRRCVTYRFAERDTAWYAAVAGQWLSSIDPALAIAVAERLLEHRKEALAMGARPPGTAEYVDALRALMQLGIDFVPGRPAAEQQPVWRDLEALIFRKDSTLAGR